MNLQNELTKALTPDKWLVNIPAIHGPDSFELIEAPCDGLIHLAPHKVSVNLPFHRRHVWHSPNNKITEVTIRVKDK